MLKGRHMFLQERICKQSGKKPSELKKEEREDP
jgi:hypothetical protein